MCWWKICSKVRNLLQCKAPWDRAGPSENERNKAQTCHKEHVTSILSWHTHKKAVASLGQNISAPLALIMAASKEWNMWQASQGTNLLQQLLLHTVSPGNYGPTASRIEHRDHEKRMPVRCIGGKKHVKKIHFAPLCTLAWRSSKLNLYGYFQK